MAAQSVRASTLRAQDLIEKVDQVLIEGLIPSTLLSFQSLSKARRQILDRQCLDSSLLQLPSGHDQFPL
jgi:hypothetical protein